MSATDGVNTSLLSSNDIAKAVLTFALGIISTALGFFLALHYNAKRDDKRDMEAFVNIQRAIISECTYNQRILEATFKRLDVDSNGKYPVFNALTTNFSSQQSQSLFFIKYADSVLLNAVQDYTRLCGLANTQKDTIVYLRTIPEKRERLEQYRYAINTTIPKIEESIRTIIESAKHRD